MRASESRAFAMPSGSRRRSPGPMWQPRCQAASPDIVGPGRACYIKGAVRACRIGIGATMSRRRQIYEGSAKVLFEGPEPGTLVQHFKDDAAACNNQKRGTITGKGVLNNRICEFLMLKLAEIGIPTHFVRRLNMREQLVREVEIIPLV